MFGSISQKSLHSFHLKFGDQLDTRASVFPLFDDEGRTRELMLTSSRDGQILLPEHHGTLFAGRSLLPRAWPQRIAARRSDLRDGELERRDHLAELWHFDPWWVLREPRYTNHPLVPTLQHTNLPGFDPSITGIWFDRTLSRVTWMAIGAADARKVRRFSPRRLAEAKRERERQGPVAEHAASWRRGSGRQPSWRLRPFWEV